MTTVVICYNNSDYNRIGTCDDAGTLPEGWVSLPCQSDKNLTPYSIAYHPSNLIKSPFFCFTCSIVHCFGDLSGRQRSSRVPCRKRSPEKWS
jgi:hypothetical protein